MQDAWMIRDKTWCPVFPPASAWGGEGACPFHIWGIVNVTPDSFYDGGTHPDFASAMAHAEKLAKEGATVLDIGGASSRPGSEDVSAKEELARVLPVVEALAARTSWNGAGARPLLSVDTWRADVAAAVLEAGADVINDISACTWEPELRDVVAQYRPGYVLMHCQGRPQAMQAAPAYDDVLADVLAFFEKHMALLVKAGLPEECIMLDPGIGFGKSREHNLTLLAKLDRLLEFGRPVLLGISNKSLFGEMFGLDKNSRVEITNVCTALAYAKGITHHRVHDVAGARRALALAAGMGMPPDGKRRTCSN